MGGGGRTLPLARRPGRDCLVAGASCVESGPTAAHSRRCSCPSRTITCHSKLIKYTTISGLKPQLVGSLL